jgi:hypothetical protein
VADDETVVIKPLRLRIAAVVAAVLTLAFLVPWRPLSGGIPAGSQYFPEDRWALVGSAIALSAFWLLLFRVRVDATPDKVRVRGLFRDLTVPWSAVEAVRYSGAPWVALVLTNGEPVPLMAVMRVDGQRAVDDARRLRALLNADRAARATP